MRVSFGRPPISRSPVERPQRISGAIKMEMRQRVPCARCAICGTVGALEGRIGSDDLMEFRIFGMLSRFVLFRFAALAIPIVSYGTAVSAQCAGPNCTSVVLCIHATGETLFGAVPLDRRGVPSSRARTAVRSATSTLTCTIDWGSFFNRGTREQIVCGSGRERLLGHVNPIGQMENNRGIFFRGVKYSLWTGTDLNRSIRMSNASRAAARLCNFVEPRQNPADTAANSSDSEEGSGREFRGRDGTGGGGETVDASQNQPGNPSGPVVDTAARLGISPAEAALIAGALTANDRVTQSIANAIQSRGRICSRVALDARADCMRQGYRHLAQLVQRRGDYSGVRQALDRVSAELDSIVASNKRRNRPSAGTFRVQGRVLREDYARIRDRGRDEAVASILSTEELLLRAVPREDPRHVHYQRIASAFAGSAQLLRS